MAAPTVIKWTDSGAPQLLRAASSFIAILDFCLPQRGWSKEFSATDKAVYRAGSGEGKFYQVIDDGNPRPGDSWMYSYAKVSAYDTMTAIDTGIGKWATDVLVFKTRGDNINPPWVCVFDEKGFWFITFPYATTDVALIGTMIAVPHYFGETSPALPGQTARNIAMGAYYWNYNSPVAKFHSFSENPVAANKIACNRKLDGTATAILAWLISAGFETNDGYQSISSGNFKYIPRVYDYPYNGELIRTRPMLNDGLINTPGDYIPGLYGSFHNGLSLLTMQQIGDFLILRVSGTYQTFDVSQSGVPQAFGAILIDLSMGFRA